MVVEVQVTEDLLVVSNEERLSVVELSVEDAECRVCWAADNVSLAGLGRQTDSRYRTAVMHFTQHRRERSAAKRLCTTTSLIYKLQ